MQTMTEALATLDDVAREIEGLRCTELRDALRRYANALRELIKAINKFDRPPQLAQPARRTPKLYLVRHSGAPQKNPADALGNADGKVPIRGTQYVRSLLYTAAWLTFGYRLRGGQPHADPQIFNRWRGDRPVPLVCLSAQQGVDAMTVESPNVKGMWTTIEIDEAGVETVLIVETDLELNAAQAAFDAAKVDALIEAATKSFAASGGTIDRIHLVPIRRGIT